MCRLSVRTYHAGAWCKLGTNTAVKPVRMQEPRTSRLRASATTHLARLLHKEQRRRVIRSSQAGIAMKMRRFMLLMLAIAGLALLPVPAKAQALADSTDSSGTVGSTPPALPDLIY